MTELDLLLSAVSNPTRRAILELLAKEPHYVLQMAKEIGVSQQAIMKHMIFLEDAGIVESREEPSPDGPARRYYALKKRFSIRINVRPDYFDSSVQVFDKAMETEDSKLMDEYRNILSEGDLQKRAERLASFLDDVEKNLRILEDAYNRLVELKEVAQREAHTIISQISRDYRQREVLYCLIDPRVEGIEDISDLLDIRQRVIVEMLDEMAVRQRFVRHIMDNFKY